MHNSITNIPGRKIASILKPLIVSGLTPAGRIDVMIMFLLLEKKIVFCYILNKILGGTDDHPWTDRS